MSDSDLTGKRYGKLLVLRQGASVSSGTAWICMCDCGLEFSVARSNLKRGTDRCRGCADAVLRHDLTGQMFGRLRAIEFMKEPHSRGRWKCQCECGNETLVVTGSLTSGQTLSCGCLGLERRVAATTKHGMTNHPLYDAWTNMRQRCLNPNHQSYHRYGGRGITICERWESFDAFVEDMQPTWRKGLTIERIDPNGDYSPSNCEWVTQKMQSRNREMTIRVEIKGRLMTLPEVSERYGINQHTLWYRWRAGRRGEDLVKPVKRAIGR